MPCWWALIGAKQLSMPAWVICLCACVYVCFSADIGIIYSTPCIQISRLHNDCKAVRLFTMEVTKAFDPVNHSKLSAKLKQLPLNPSKVNWYHSFFFVRHKRISHNNHLCNGKAIIKGTTQGSVTGPFFLYLIPCWMMHKFLITLFYPYKTMCPS